LFSLFCLRKFRH